MRLITLALSLIATAPAFAGENPYFPLEVGRIAKLQYEFRVESDRKEFTQANTRGRITTTAEAWEPRNGRSYLRFLSVYEGIPFMKEPAKLWRREEAGGIFMGSEIRGNFKETLELPAEPVVGVEWDYDDGVKSRRKVTAATSITLPTGETLNDCIEVTRTVSGNNSLKNVTDKNIYCRNRGNVRSLFVQPTPVGDYRTETLQESMTANPERTSR